MDGFEGAPRSRLQIWLTYVGDLMLDISELYPILWRAAPCAVQAEVKNGL